MKVKNHAGTPLSIAQQQTIKANLAEWRRHRQSRKDLFVQRDFPKHFNSISQAMAGKRVFV